MNWKLLFLKLGITRYPEGPLNVAEVLVLANSLGFRLYGQAKAPRAEHIIEAERQLALGLMTLERMRKELSDVTEDYLREGARTGKIIPSWDITKLFSLEYDRHDLAPYFIARHVVERHAWPKEQDKLYNELQRVMNYKRIKEQKKEHVKTRVLEIADQHYRRDVA